MPDRWFRIPETGTATRDDPLRPKHLRGMGLGYSGRTSHPDGAPSWVVRVYGSSADLDEVASNPATVELGDVPVTTLNRMFGVDRTAADWERSFRVDY